MTDGPERSADDRRQSGGGAVTSLASQALSLLATRRLSVDARKEEALLAEIEAAVLDRDPTRRAAVLAEMRMRAIPDAWVAEVLIPEVARRLGEAWCEDDKSFAEVTIGSARLQAMVRDLDPSDASDALDEAPLLAVIVPEDESHTLGALTLAGQLRRLGFSVKLFLGASEADLIGALSAARFDAVLVSASQGDRLSSLARLVKRMRLALPRTTPIIVGGSAVTRGLGAKGRIGADHFTSDVFEALSACGLKMSGKDDQRNEVLDGVKAPAS